MLQPSQVPLFHLAALLSVMLQRPLRNHRFLSLRLPHGKICPNLSPLAKRLEEPKVSLGNPPLPNRLLHTSI